jgi:hypothetical protein
MRLCKYFPTPEEILENEKETFFFLKKQRDIASYFPIFHGDVCNTLDRLNVLKLRKDPINLYNFESYMCIKLDGITRRVYLGGIIDLGSNQVYKEVSYSMAICESTDPNSRVIRRFHFDFVSNEDNSRPLDKPFFHLQYGGEMSPRMKKEGITDQNYNHIDSKFSLPRISYLPMCFIFLVFFAIKELDKDHSDILCKSEWKAQMRRSEELMLKKYHETCSRAINNEKSIFMDCYY